MSQEVVALFPVSFGVVPPLVFTSLPAPHLRVSVPDCPPVSNNVCEINQSEQNRSSDVQTNPVNFSDLYFLYFYYKLIAQLSFFYYSNHIFCIVNSVFTFLFIRLIEKTINR